MTDWERLGGVLRCAAGGVGSGGEVSLLAAAVGDLRSPSGAPSERQEAGRRAAEHDQESHGGYSSVAAACEC